MRVVLAGLILLAVNSAALAQAEAEGEVESLGFHGWYRPNCWTPVKIRLRPKTGTSRNYQIQVLQEDMDRDHVAYSRPITLTGNPEGRKIEEKVWVYFIPQPHDLQGNLSAAELSNRIKIFLCDEKGRQLTQIPIPPNTTFRNIDDVPMMVNSPRGMRLVLLVGTSSSAAPDSVFMNARGINEDVHFEPMSVQELPGNPIGYQGVDAVVWLDADPSALTSDGQSALQDYVRDGGRLVVCHSAQWQKLKESPLAEMLPVFVQSTEDETGARTLRKLAGIPMPEAYKKPTTRPAVADPIEIDPADASRRQLLSRWTAANGQALDPWEPLAETKIAIGKAVVRTNRDGQPNPDVLVPLWREGMATDPYLARWLYGLGTVTWVAQDYGDPNLHPRHRWRLIGWARIWDATFDWPNNTVTVADRGGLAGDVEAGAFLGEMANKNLYDNKYGGTSSTTDLSTALLKLMEHGSTGAALVALAVLFFIGYWVVAGPGTFAFLKARKQAIYSWPAFAVCAVAATALTAGVVRLVLRGPPQLRHVTFVRTGIEGEAVIRSNIGLYIKRDGMQPIELKDALPKRSSYLAPYPAHPAHSRDAVEVLAYQSYTVPVRDRNSADPVRIEVPYRSTLKKLQARWVGKMDGGIGGRLRLSDGNPVGRLTNDTGRDLRSVCMLYRPSPDASSDMLIMLPDGADGSAAWPKQQPIDIRSLFDQNLVRNVSRDTRLVRTKEQVAVRGFLRTWREELWDKEFRGLFEPIYGDSDRAALLLSIFDRIEPSVAESSGGMGTAQRYDLLRRAGRELDASSVVSAGHMLIFARSENNAPLPYPLEVDGDRVMGEGIVYYQFVVPIERSGPATQPVRERVIQSR